MTVVPSRRSRRASQSGCCKRAPGLLTGELEEQLKPVLRLKKVSVWSWVIQDRQMVLLRLHLDHCRRHGDLGQEGQIPRVHWPYELVESRDA
eukprot:284839-Rhodomonas_salina.1